MAVEDVKEGVLKAGAVTKSKVVPASPTMVVNAANLSDAEHANPKFTKIEDASHIKSVDQEQDHL